MQGVKQYFWLVSGTYINLTDDTQMTQELADSLIEKDGFDAGDLALRFTVRYYRDGRGAGYGCNVVDVFSKLRDSNYSDPLQPARQQFGGTGSYGNGAAMRVAPAALCGFPSFERTSKLAELSAIVTHTHVYGRHGAVFQALALRWTLLLSPSDNMTPLPLLALIEEDLMQFKICDAYMEKIKMIKKLLGKERLSDTVVEAQLGTGVAALESVPTALFCFLRCLRPIPELPTVNGFRRTVEYAISLGGDTDTTSMAGALAGAYYGLPGIDTNTMKSCPDHERALSQADVLYSIAMSKAEAPDSCSSVPERGDLPPEGAKQNE